MLNLEDDDRVVKDGRTYPSDYVPGPGQHWSVNAAWEIVDAVEPGVLTDAGRAVIAGRIAGRLLRAKAEGK